MNPQLETFDEILNALAEVRKNIQTRQKFPIELWDAIIRLAQTHPIEEISSRLNISIAYLRRKIRQSKGSSSSINFQEVSHYIPGICQDAISIELTSDFGLTARIQGPSSCLSFLGTLFRR